GTDPSFRRRERWGQITPRRRAHAREPEGRRRRLLRSRGLRSLAREPAPHVTSLHRIRLPPLFRVDDPRHDLSLRAEEPRAVRPPAPGRDPRDARWNWAHRRSGGTAVAEGAARSHGPRRVAINARCRIHLASPR